MEKYRLVITVTPGQKEAWLEAKMGMSITYRGVVSIEKISDIAAKISAAKDDDEFLCIVRDELGLKNPPY